MKTVFNLVLSAIVCLLVISITGVVCSGAVYDVPSKSINNSVDVQSVIHEVLTEEEIAESYSRMDTRYCPENYAVDIDKYVIEYGVSTTFWENAKWTDYQGFAETVDSTPTVYVPVLAEIPDGQGQVRERVIGHCKVYYDFFKNGYIMTMVIKNTTAPGFAEGEIVHFYEEIGNYLNSNNLDADQVVIIRYPNSYNDFSEKVAFIICGEEIVVFDFSNSLHLDNKEIRKKAYSVDEYRELRLNVEESIYKGQNDIGGEVGGLSGTSDTTGRNNVLFSNGLRMAIVVACTAILTAILTALTIMLIRRKTSTGLRRKSDTR